MWRNVSTKEDRDETKTTARCLVLVNTSIFKISLLENGSRPSCVLMDEGVDVDAGARTARVEHHAVEDAAGVGRSAQAHEETGGAAVGGVRVGGPSGPGVSRRRQQQQQQQQQGWRRHGVCPHPRSRVPRERRHRVQFLPPRCHRDGGVKSCCGQTCEIRPTPGWQLTHYTHLTASTLHTTTRLRASTLIDKPESFHSAHLLWCPRIAFQWGGANTHTWR